MLTDLPYCGAGDPPSPPVTRVKGEGPHTSQCTSWSSLKQFFDSFWHAVALRGNTNHEDMHALRIHPVYRIYRHHAGLAVLAKGLGDGAGYFLGIAEFAGASLQRPLDKAAGQSYANPFPPVLDRSGVLCPVCVPFAIEAHYGYDLLGRLGSSATKAKRCIPSTFMKYPAFLLLSSGLAPKKRK